MALTPSQQFQELLKKTQTPLVLIPAYPNRDAVASAFALALFLQNSGKEVTLAGENLEHEIETLAFLAQPNTILSSIAGARDFVLSFNTERNKIINVRTESTEGEVRIYLTPENGSIDPRDFSFIPAQFKFDLAIIIGAADKESLGKIYTENPDIFYEIPLVNIDNHAENELFGQVNLVDVTASANAEILADVLEKSAPNLLTETVTEALLTGIISATDSFQKRNTTPKALKIASHLMDQGADQQKIVQALYKTQPLHLLKLWGRVMGQAKWNESLKLIWSFVTIEDLVQARAKIADLPQVLEKIKGNYSSAHLFMILSPESNTQIHIIVKASTPENLTSLKTHFSEGLLHGDTFAFSLDATSLEEAEQIILQKLQQSSLPHSSI
ncbi:MAG: DHH family phosphoesterase [Minisyncoccota bacterium]